MPTLQVPQPRPGRRFMLMELEAELVVKAGRLIPNGSAEAELARRLEDTIREFIRSSPIDVLLPLRSM
jgi:hypothetical protein